MRRSLIAALFVLAACGQQQPPAETETETAVAPVETPATPQRAALPEVDPTLLAAPNSAFTAIEPSEVGVFAAPGVMEAIDILIGPETQAEGSGAVHATVRETGDRAIADILRTGLADDSVTAGHVRIEFRREPDGWYPTNAYRRSMCARGELANQWTSGLCP